MKTEIQDMSDREFLEQMKAGVPVQPGTRLGHKLDALGWNARWITNYLNCVAHRPHVVRLILERLTGRHVPDSVDVQPPFYAQIGIGLHFGHHVTVGQDVHLLDLGGIHLGDNVTIGCAVTIMTSLPGVRAEDRSVLYPASVRVERDVWIGPGVIIMPGVIIGAGAVISPGSLVAEDVAPGIVAAGRPARYVRDI